jgi:hypothetical protein
VNGYRRRDANLKGTDMAERISFQELEDKLRDIDTPDEELVPYFIGDPEASKPFQPILKPNPATVETTPVDEFRIEGAFAMDWANGIARWRRQQRFRRDAGRGDKPILVTEGDSWFQFPIFLKDVIDRLDEDYYVWCVGAAGDDLQTMVHDEPEYLDALDMNRDTFKAFLFSGAGNDIVGEKKTGGSFLEEIIRPYEEGRPPAWFIETDGFAERLAFIEHAYRVVLEQVEREYPGRPVLLHGYDRAIPGGFAGDPRSPLYAAKNAWIGRYLKGDILGFNDDALERQIIALMIDRLNELQKRLCGGNNPGGAFPHAYHVDLRGTLTEVGHWADELHPTDNSSVRVAARFREVLRQAGIPG